ncbi:MAG: hypothetical protein V1784_00940 [bacterium]
MAKDHDLPFFLTRASQNRRRFTEVETQIPDTLSALYPIRSRVCTFFVREMADARIHGGTIGKRLVEEESPHFPAWSRQWRLGNRQAHGYVWFICDACGIRPPVAGVSGRKYYVK